MNWQKRKMWTLFILILPFALALTAPASAATIYANGVVSEESDPVTGQLPAPVIYKAPAEGDATVRVLRVFDDATAAGVLRDDGGAELDTFFGLPEEDEDFVDVTVNGVSNRLDPSRPKRPSAEGMEGRGPARQVQ